MNLPNYRSSTSFGVSKEIPDPVAYLWSVSRDDGTGKELSLPESKVPFNILYRKKNYKVSLWLVVADSHGPESC